MELTQMSQLIEQKIKQMDAVDGILDILAEQKSSATGLYELALAKKIIQLKNGIEFNIDGEKVQNPPTTIIEKIAKGLCYSESIHKDLCESKYKNAITRIDMLKSQLNGYQSINRYMKEI